MKTTLLGQIVIEHHSPLLYVFRPQSDHFLISGPKKLPICPHIGQRSMRIPEMETNKQ